jgi:hypothetical protein
MSQCEQCSVCFVCGGSKLKIDIAEYDKASGNGRRKQWTKSGRNIKVKSDLNVDNLLEYALKQSNRAKNLVDHYNRWKKASYSDSALVWYRLRRFFRRYSSHTHTCCRVPAVLLPCYYYLLLPLPLLPLRYETCFAMFFFRSIPL